MEGTFGGVAAVASFATPDNPTGVRAIGNVRLEVATGPSTYGRGMGEITVTSAAAALGELSMTAGAGSAFGALPPQRLWYLGGPATVHAFAAGTARGDAFWLARGQLAKGNPIIRPVVFSDIGWAGPRAEWLRAPRPLASAGAGVAAFGGLVRLDVAHGLRPAHAWRADLYFHVP